MAARFSRVFTPRNHWLAVWLGKHHSTIGAGYTGHGTGGGQCAQTHRLCAYFGAIGAQGRISGGRSASLASAAPTATSPSFENPSASAGTRTRGRTGMVATNGAFTRSIGGANGRAIGGKITVSGSASQRFDAVASQSVCALAKPVSYAIVMLTMDVVTARDSNCSTTRRAYYTRSYTL